MGEGDRTQQIGDRHSFDTTHWSVVLQAGAGDKPQAAQALEKLCRTYWQPLYHYVRRQGYSPADAQDLTQAFFARLLKKKGLTQGDPQKGKFRSFLLTACDHFLKDARRHEFAQKRGGGRPPISLQEGDTATRLAREPRAQETPEKEFDRLWACQVLAEALASLRADYVASGKQNQFDQLKTFLSGTGDEGAYAAVAAQLGMTPGAISVAVHRLRQRYRQLVREQLAQTVGSPDEVDGELAWLFEVLSG